MKELEEKARAYYEGTITLSSNEFIELMVLDGCFILELFRGASEGFKLVMLEMIPSLQCVDQCIPFKET